MMPDTIPSMHTSVHTVVHIHTLITESSACQLCHGGRPTTPGVAVHILVPDVIAKLLVPVVQRVNPGTQTLAPQTLQKLCPVQQTLVGC